MKGKKTNISDKAWKKKDGNWQGGVIACKTKNDRQDKLLMDGQKRMKEKKNKHKWQRFKQKGTRKMHVCIQIVNPRLSDKPTAYTVEHTK